MLNAIDNGNLSLLTLLDLLAAFDTIDQSILLERLHTSFGIDGLPLKWVISYLSNRHQKVKIDNNLSNVLPILYGVPQGSVLGPLLFSINMYPLTDVIDDHKFFFIMYMLMTPNCIALLLAIKLIHYLTKFLHQPMTSTYGCQQTNFKMNNENTEILLCGTNARLKSVRPNSLKIGKNIIDFSLKVKKLWFVLRK